MFQRASKSSDFAIHTFFTVVPTVPAVATLIVSNIFCRCRRIRRLGRSHLEPSSLHDSSSERFHGPELSGSRTVYSSQLWQPACQRTSRQFWSFVSNMLYHSRFKSWRSPPRSMGSAQRLLHTLVDYPLGALPTEFWIQASRKARILSIVTEGRHTRSR